MLEIVRIGRLPRCWVGRGVQQAFRLRPTSASSPATGLEITNVTCHLDIESLNAPELFIQCVVGKLGSREPTMSSGDKVK
jgi:hypothetical protein